MLTLLSRQLIHQCKKLLTQAGCKNTLQYLLVQRKTDRCADTYMYSDIDTETQTHTHTDTDTHTHRHIQYVNKMSPYSTVITQMFHFHTTVVL